LESDETKRLSATQLLETDYAMLHRPVCTLSEVKFR